MDESTVIKIKGSRLDEFDEYENSERFHIKIISKNHIDNLKNLIDEIEISKLLSNITYPNINNIENIYEDNDNIYIIFEQFYGDTISSYENYTLTEKYELVKQLYKGVSFKSSNFSIICSFVIVSSSHIFRNSSQIF